MIDYVATFVSFFAVIDPIGTVPVFVAITSNQDEKSRAQTARKGTLVAAGVLLFFVIAGQPLLDAMSIPLPAFQIAGGIVLFLFALSMIFGDGKPEEEIRSIDQRDEKAVYPLAVPSLASPGAMLTAVLLTDNDHFTIMEQCQTAGVMCGVLLLAYGLMRLATPITRLIGHGGASVVSRVMGLLLSAVAATNALEGLKAFANLE
ncbi:MAG: MarC family transcriptional regulator [Rhodopirellula sp. TMED11]|nr:MAG: MarC family transcriptional regulator [Rhodopirellula sp. TMED11]